MTPRELSRMVVTAGWIGGMCLILAGLPVPAALAAPAAAMGGACALARWAPGARAWLAAMVRRRVRKGKTAGGDLARV